MPTPKTSVITSLFPSFSRTSTNKLQSSSTCRFSVVRPQPPSGRTSDSFESCVVQTKRYICPTIILAVMGGSYPSPTWSPSMISSDILTSGAGGPSSTVPISATASTFISTTQASEERQQSSPSRI